MPTPHVEPANHPNCDHCVYPQQMSQVQTHLEAQDEKLNRIIRYLEGDDLDERKPGLKVRLDRLEQRDKSRGKLMWIVITTAAGLILERAWALLTSGKP